MPVLSSRDRVAQVFPRVHPSFCRQHPVSTRHGPHCGLPGWTFNSGLATDCIPLATVTRSGRDITQARPSRGTRFPTGVLSCEPGAGACPVTLAPRQALPTGGEKETRAAGSLHLIPLDPKPEPPGPSREVRKASFMARASVNWISSLTTQRILSNFTQTHRHTHTKERVSTRGH